MKLILPILVLLLMPVAADSWADSEPANCLYARDVKQFEILDSEHLLLIGSLDRRWVSRLKTQCSGLRKNMALNVTRFGSQMCANDRVTATSRGAVRGEGPVANCLLGPFEAVTLEQVAQLKDVLAQADSS
ncbi:MAG: hypothetical protein NXH95_12245 [Pseudomonadaceae bacterium]|nr:hypothetical protein [Pseudomonadaceae bacterium]